MLLKWYIEVHFFEEKNITLTPWPSSDPWASPDHKTDTYLVLFINN